MNLEIFFSLLFLLSSSQALAAKGQVIVLEAPLFRKKSLDAEVIGWVRKGQIIYIHNNVLSNGPNDPRYQVTTDIYDKELDDLDTIDFEGNNFSESINGPRIDDFDLIIKGLGENIIGEDLQTLEQALNAPVEKPDELLPDLPAEPDGNDLPFDENDLPDEGEDLPFEARKASDKISKKVSAFERETFSDFYLTVDRNGLNAYIPKEYVKVLYKDEREQEENINPFDHDPTDYRLQEPLPDSYPLVSNNQMRAFFSMGSGTEPRESYNYTREVRSQNYGTRYAFKAVILKRGNVFGNNRFFFGGGLQLSLINSSFLMEDTDERSREQKLRFRAGPYFLYDAYLYKNVLFSFQGGIWLTYNAFSVFQSEPTFDTAQERKYSGFSIAPHVGFVTQWKDLFGKNFDLVTELNGRLEAPYTLNSSADSDYSDFLWNNAEEDIYEGNWQSSFELAFGIQINI